MLNMFIYQYTTPTIIIIFVVRKLAEVLVSLVSPAPMLSQLIIARSLTSLVLAL